MKIERKIERCGETFQAQRRNQTYHNQGCKQNAYYQRTKRNKNLLRIALVLPVLLLFPGSCAAAIPMGSRWKGTSTAQGDEGRGLVTRALLFTSISLSSGLRSQCRDMNDV